MKIEIKKPFITNNKNKSRLNAVIQTKKKQFTLWFEVNKKYSKYLCTEKIDAFIITLLPWAMMQSKSKKILEIQSKYPMSERLFHQLINYQIPTLVKNISYFNDIKITVPTTSKILPSNSSIATGISGGVDSSYTIAKYITSKNKKYRLTHGIFYNMAMYGDFNSKSVLSLKKRVKKMCKLTNIHFIEIASNTCIQLYKRLTPQLFHIFSWAPHLLFKNYFRYIIIPQDSI